jgi:hypothetical protein
MTKNHFPKRLLKTHDQLLFAMSGNSLAFIVNCATSARETGSEQTQDQQGAADGLRYRRELATHAHVERFASEDRPGSGAVELERGNADSVAEYSIRSQDLLTESRAEVREIAGTRLDPEWRSGLDQSGCRQFTRDDEGIGEREGVQQVRTVVLERVEIAAAHVNNARRAERDISQAKRARYLFEQPVVKRVEIRIPGIADERTVITLPGEHKIEGWHGHRHVRAKRERAGN